MALLGAGERGEAAAWLELAAGREVGEVVVWLELVAGRWVGGRSSGTAGTGGQQAGAAAAVNPLP